MIAMPPPETHPGPAGPPHRGRAAFTLIEIMIAIGVVVALIAVAVPTIVLSFGDRKLEAEAERLGATMASLRAESVRQRETLALFLEPSTGEFGGSLFIGPLSSADDEPVRLPSDRPLGWGGPEEAGEIPTRRIFETERPFVLSDQQPSADLESQYLSGAPGDMASGSSLAGAEPAERIRIAVSSASGQILASRPLWLFDDRAMFRVEIGSGVGNAIVSGPRMILTDPLVEDEDEADADNGSGAEAPSLPDPGGEAPPARPDAEEDGTEAP